MRALGWIVLAGALVACGSDDGEDAAGTGGSGGAASGGTAGSGGSAGNSGAGGSAGNSSTGGSSGASGSAGSGPVPTVPAELLDLSSWKLTLPIAEPGSTDKPLEILQPELASYSIDPWFVLNAAKDGVQFRANAGGVTTSNSGYPRSELREMTADGMELASWSTSSGTHAMTIRQAITQLPVAKPHVVAGQIHDSADDVVMIRLEGETLFVEGGGSDLGVLDPAYTLGKVFSVRLVAENARIKIFYEDLATPKVDVARDASGCYFKAGVYTQSNTGTGDEPSAYGEVVIHELSVSHQ